MRTDQPDIKIEPVDDNKDGKNEEKVEVEIKQRKMLDENRAPKTPKKYVAMGLKRKIASQKKIKKRKAKKAKLLTELAENILKLKN